MSVQHKTKAGDSASENIEGKTDLELDLEETATIMPNYKLSLSLPFQDTTLYH